MSIFKSCDVRGVVGVEWGTAEAHHIGNSLGQMACRSGAQTMVVGGDFRRSTRELKAALVEGLLEEGIDVEDVGQLPTPAVYYFARHSDCPNVAIVTASHNPGQYNGIKIQLAGQPAVPDLIEELKQGPLEETRSAKRGHVRTCRALPGYETWVLKQARALQPAKSRTSCSIVLDMMGGAFSGIGPRILELAGHQVAALHNRIDADFQARPPNPAEDANLQELVDEVLQQRADLGIALDGDGDRVVFVDHRGCIVRPEQIAALLVRKCFTRPTLVYDLKCASIVPRSVEAKGGVAIMQPSGYGFIKAKMLESRADLGVEVSGHHFYGALDGGDDGLLTALVVLQLLQASGESLADLLSSIGWPAITPDLRIPYHGDPATLIERIAASCGGEVSRMDGVRAQYGTGSWALARASITEPVITFRFEGTGREPLPSIAARFLVAVPELHQRVKERMNEQTAE